MSPRAPMLKARDVARVLHLLGFVKKRQDGSHMFYAHNDGRVTTIPHHGGKDIGRGLLRKIMRDINIPPKEFYGLL